MKYELAKKAWEINFDNIEEGYLYDQGFYVVYANTRNKAKSKLLTLADCEGIRLKGEEDEVDYLTIPVIRSKKYDKYYFEGEALTIYSIEGRLRERERLESLQEILDNNSIKFCYIKKGSYYRPNSCGYTDFTHMAGVYTKEEAVSKAESCEDLRIIPIDISEHNKMIEERIKDLTTRLIKQ